jgi:hypothetical protein
VSDCGAARGWHTLTLLGGHLQRRPAGHHVTIESRTDLEPVLCPRLRPGQVVVMHTLSAHKHPAVRPLIEHAGAQLLYLRPYGFHPIEAC